MQFVVLTSRRARPTSLKEADLGVDLFRPRSTRPETPHHASDAERNAALCAKILEDNSSEEEEEEVGKLGLGGSGQLPVNPAVKTAEDQRVMVTGNSFIRGVN